MTLQERLDQLLIEESQKKRTRSGKYNPSSLGGCFRKQYLNRQDAPKKEYDVKTLHIFKSGNIIEEVIQSTLYEKKEDIEISDEHFFGFPDIVTDNAVIDVKSTNPAYFFFNGFGQSSGELTPDQIDARIREKKINNILQCCHYAVELKKPFFGLAFVSRDLSYGLRVHEWMARTEEYDLMLAQEKARLIDYWDKQELPPAEPRLFNGKECQYCDYYGVSCEGNSKTKKGK